MNTKEINIQVKGKDGWVNSSSIQQHMPDDKMCFISLENGHFLFCQENHPIIVKRDDSEIVIEAKDIQLKDSIWFDNTFINDIADSKIISEDPYEELQCLYDMTHVGRFLKKTRLFKGNSFTLRMHPEILSVSNEWLEQFITHFANDLMMPQAVVSPALAMQIKLVCDKLSIPCRVFNKVMRDNINVMYLHFDIENRKDCINKGYEEIVDVDYGLDWAEHVYDVKTESSEFMCGALQTHNSFHLGGAVSIKSVDLIDELMVNTDELLRPKVEKRVKQKDDSIYSDADYAMISIDKTIFDKTPFKREEDKLILPAGYFELDVEDLKLRSSIEQETTVHLSDSVEENDTHIDIIYGKGERMYTVISAPKDYTKLAQVMDGLVSGKSPSFDPESLYLKFMRSLYAFEEPYDSVHIEVIISNILRNKKDPQKPARLVEPYEYEMFSIKTLPMIISYPLGIGFENFGKAVQYGMISDRSPSSPIEKVMFGETLVTDKDLLAKRKKK